MGIYGMGWDISTGSGVRHEGWYDAMMAWAMKSGNGRRREEKI